MSDMRQSLDLNFANALLDPWSGEVNIYLANKTPTHLETITDLVMLRTDLNDTEAHAPKMASIKLSKEAAQRLLDALLSAGVRPSDEVESRGHLGALKAHLADMRHLAFLTITGEKQP